MPITKEITLLHFLHIKELLHESDIMYSWVVKTKLDNILGKYKAFYQESYYYVCFSFLS